MGWRGELPGRTVVSLRRQDAGARLTDALALASADLRRHLERRLGVEEAADALAELMVTAWRRVDALPEGEEDARMWLFGIARHVVGNVQRGERRRWRLADRLRDLLAQSPAEAGPADAGMEVRDAIARLEPAQAELVRLVHWDGLSLVEAAGVLGIPASTARGRYQRARADLRAALTVETAAQ